MTIKLRQRTPFARWMWEHGLTPKDGEGPLRKSWESIRRYALDFDAPQRVIPDEETVALIFAWTQGRITAADHYPPHLRPVAPAEPDAPPADEDWASRNFLDAPAAA